MCFRLLWFRFSSTLNRLRVFGYGYGFTPEFLLQGLSMSIVNPTRLCGSAFRVQSECHVAGMGPLYLQGRFAFFIAYPHTPNYNLQTPTPVIQNMYAAVTIDAKDDHRARHQAYCSILLSLQ